MSGGVSETYIQLVLQLDAANAAALAAKKALADHVAAEERASLMEMRTEIKRRPDAHALLEWIEQRITGDIRVVLNDYFVAMDETAEADEPGSEQDLHGRLAAAEHDVAELLAKNMELLHERALRENAEIDEATSPVEYGVRIGQLVTTSWGTDKAGARKRADELVDGGVSVPVVLVQRVGSAKWQVSS